jgi:hypothetical protein
MGDPCGDPPSLLRKDDVSGSCTSRLWLCKKEGAVRSLSAGLKLRIAYLSFYDSFGACSVGGCSRRVCHYRPFPGISAALEETRELSEAVINLSGGGMLLYNLKNNSERL